MNSRTLYIILLAVVCGGSAAVGVYLLTADRGAASSASAATVQLLVTQEDIPRGGQITDLNVALQEWPSELVPEGAATTLEDVLDRSVVIPLVKGETLNDKKLAPKSAGLGLASLVPDGMRAFTIRTPDVVTSVAGFVLPGNKVDVLLTLKQLSQDDPTGGGATITLLQNVEILAVEQNLGNSQEQKTNPKELTSVTVLATPDQAAMLALGQEKGVLQLSLRHPGDTAEMEARMATVAELRMGHALYAASLDDHAVEPAPPEEEQITAKTIVPPAWRIRTLRGTQSGNVFIEPPKASEQGS